MDRVEFEVVHCNINSLGIFSLSLLSSNICFPLLSSPSSIYLLETPLTSSRMRLFLPMTFLFPLVVDLIQQLRTISSSVEPRSQLRGALIVFAAIFMLIHTLDFCV